LAAPTIQPLEAPLPVLPDSPLIFGPKKLDRLGLTMAVDLGGDDVVLSVSRDTRMPRASVVVTTAARYIIRTAKMGEKLETLAIRGSVNDPTLHPEFRAITSNLRDLRNKWFSKAKLILVTDNPHFENSDVRSCLGIFDRVIVRLEAGTAKTYAALTGRKTSDYTSFMNHLAPSEKLSIQARFYKGGEVDNTTEAEIKAWVKKLGELKPREVFLLNPEAKPTNKKLKPATKARVSEIGKDLAEKTGIPSVILSAASVLG